MNTDGHGLTDPRPRVSIGLPVRNGARHIAQAIESLLGQTLRDVEIEVCDNASTDDTPAIVQSIARREPRLRLIRHAQDIGGAANFIFAAEQARGDSFCWAAHDDLREPMFLQTLVALLGAHPEAALACCAVRNIDPDGTPRDVRPETASLRTTTGMTSSQRLRMYLRETPGTPFYGLFRTVALRQTLDTLRQLDELGGGAERPAIMGIDMIFLARFVRDHGIAYTPQPLVQFRRGGVSHNLGRYGSLREYLRQLWMYRRLMKSVTACAQADWRDRILTRVALWRSMARWLASRDMRCMSAHYLAQSMPILHSPRAWLAARTDRHLRRLSDRVGRLPAGSRIVLFGAGKHTRRRIEHLRQATGARASIVAACDDRAGECEHIPGLRIVAPDAMANEHADIVLVSSDAYEASMYRRARDRAPPGIAVWTLYDRALEKGAADSDNAASSASTPAMNLAISSSESPALPIAAR